MSKRVFQEAMELLQSGRGGEAETMLLKEAAAIRARYGDHSHEHAMALFDVANLLMAADDLDRAIEFVRSAAEIEPNPDNEAGCQDQLTYFRNLGEMLEYANRLDEAEEVLREGLRRRLAYYGREHAGYGFGLESLADLLWKKGEIDEAMELAREAVDNLWNQENPQVFSALALRGFIHVAAKLDGNPFADIPRLSDENLERIIKDMTFKSEFAEPAPSAESLLHLYRWVRHHHGAVAEPLIPIVMRIAELERLAGNQEGRRDSLRHLIELCRARNDSLNAIRAAEALGLAEHEAGDLDAADAAYRQALDCAQDYGDPECLSHVLRNYGLYCRDAQRLDDAEALLRTAVEAAKTAQDPKTQGRALAALGILVQHAGRLDEAREMLEQAVSLLPQGHPDLIYARSHLDAVVNDQSCGCGDIGGAISKTLLDLVTPQLPDGLLKDLTYSPDGRVNIQLSREPDEEEIELMNRVIDHAIRQLRGQAKSYGTL